MQSIRIFHPSAKVWIKRGFKDFFVVYAGLGIITVSFAVFMYDWRNGLQVVRYKPQYTVFRAGDELTKLYPKHYITDNHLLSADHPTTLEDCDPLPKGKPVFQGQLFKTIGQLFKD